MLNYKVNSYLKVIFIISFISLISAYFIEYVLGHQPCNLCLIERIPYGLSMILIILNYLEKKNEHFVILLLTLIFSFSLIISFYHFGIEQGFFEESSVCGLKNISDIIKSLKYQFFNFFLCEIYQIHYLLLSFFAKKH